MDVAIYARVSTASQTVENQLIELRDAAKRLGWTCLSPLKLSHYCSAIGECFGWLGSAIRMRIV